MHAHTHTSSPGSCPAQRGRMNLIPSVGREVGSVLPGSVGSLGQACILALSRHLCEPAHTHTHTNFIHTLAPNLTLLAPIPTGWTKDLIVRFVARRRGGWQGAAAVTMATELTHFSSTQPGPPSPDKGGQASLGQGGPSPVTRSKGVASEGVVKEELSLRPDTKATARHRLGRAGC